ncbi:MAG: hypothetical protein A3I66_00695 [Burkholderiales bacterium RIFCSPLOWO2_02_FULL_57_36]|nr:MAG: hypothetical protein A3I66_00695 [Burkholderiales bacterium RIFCSPLOWO2_02_FULL_57_36]
MARIDWIKHRLENWALWKVREASGGMGWATQSVLLSDPVDRSREIMLPVDEVDAEKTNQAVESLRLGRGHLYVTLQFIYIKGVGIKETARNMARAESTVKANLDHADHAIAQWFADQAELKKKRSFTT